MLDGCNLGGIAETELSRTHFYGQYALFCWNNDTRRQDLRPVCSVPESLAILYSVHEVAK